MPQEQQKTVAGAGATEETLPRQFGKYTLLRRLAAGGMAELFLALQRSVAGFEKLIVIKRILPSMNHDKGFIEMLLHEARIAATLSHPNIVQIFDVGQIEGTYFIAMEHIHGEDIRSIVRSMKKNGVTEFPLEHALSILIGTCAGLAYAHDKRDLDGVTLDIVHRDISPQNIVVTFTGDVKIVDFGIAKSGTSGAGEDTKDGQLKGKVAYMSPEQAAGQPVDWRSDVFAAGVMLFELTTGRRLFRGGSEYETLKLICDKDYPKPSELRPDYPAALERIVMRSLAKKREDRYQSAREMQSDLEAFVREERIPASMVGLTRWMQQLFADKLAQQKEALQDVKQLADVIAHQSERLSYDATASGTTSVGMMSGPGSMAPAPAKRGRLGAVFALALALAVGAGAIVYVKSSAAVKEREQAEARAREAAAAQAAIKPEVIAKGTLELQSKPEGCSIWINGDLQKEVTPAKIDGLPLDRELDVKLTKEGLEPHREKLTLSKEAPARTLSAELRVGSVTVVLKVEPEPTIWLDGKPWLGTNKGKLEGLSAGEEHRLVLTAPGYQPKTVVFTAQQGETKTVTETLFKADPSAPVDAKTPPVDDKPVAAAVGGSGTVRVGAKGGYCNVTINGVSYGPTPTQATVNAGTARVSCKPPTGRTLSQAVKVNAGETARVSFKIEE
jgi:serine/threonine-protein kinase